MHIDDCVEGTLRIMAGDSPEPVNLGSEEVVTINELADLVQTIAVSELEYRYVLDAPKGVDARNSENTLIRARYGWEPSIGLREGLVGTYDWIAEQVGALAHA
jgi:nucleoside-diphosphate-sugar epimerase